MTKIYIACLSSFFLTMTYFFSEFRFCHIIMDIKYII